MYKFKSLKLSVLSIIALALLGTGLTGCSAKSLNTFSDIIIEATKSPAQKKKDEENAAFRKARESWFGKSIDRLVASWGGYNNVHNNSDGTAIYTWKEVQTGTWGDSTVCIDNFWVDQKRIITKWTTSGCFR